MDVRQLRLLLLFLNQRLFLSLPQRQMSVVLQELMDRLLLALVAELLDIPTHGYLVRLQDLL